MKDIVITGVGIVSAIGNSTSSVLESLKNEASGIGKIRYLASIHEELPIGEVKLSNKELAEILKLEQKNQNLISRTTLMGAVALRQALKDANISCFGNKRIAFINGTTVGGMDITEQYFSRMKTDDA